MAGSWGPRKMLACTLVGLGAFSIVTAVLIPAYSVGKLAKIPLDLEVTTVATTPSDPGGGADVLESRTLTSPTGAAKVSKNVPLVSQRFITVEDPADARDMTLQAGQTLRRTDKQGDTGLLSATVDRVTVNRRDSWPTEDPIGSIQIQADKPADEVDHSGWQYRLPFNTQKTAYPYFDINTRSSVDIEFADTTEINNLPVYHFTQQIPPTDLSQVVKNVPTNRFTLPANKWGVHGGKEMVTMTRWYTTKRDLWVEPKTGIIVKAQEQPFFFYGRSADKPELTVLKANLTYDENTIESQIAAAKDSKDKLSLYGRVLPIGLGVIGLIALLAGVFLGYRESRKIITPAPDDSPTTVFPRI